MLIFRNHVIFSKLKFSLIKHQLFYLSEFNNNNNNSNDDKSLVEKLDAMLKKAKNEIESMTVNPLFDKEARHTFTEAVSTPITEKPLSNKVAKITSRLTPWTMPNLLKPLNLDDLPSRKSQKSDTQPRSFASFLRNSTLMQLGDFNLVRVIGVVFEVVDDDLYIDFGGKFYCVCQAPDQDKYVRGSLVKLLLKDMELTSTFMLDKVATTLLEADGQIIGPLQSINVNDIKMFWTP